MAFPGDAYGVVPQFELELGEPMKCTHPPCTCRVDDAGGFCDPACLAGNGTGVTCLCGHPMCEATPGGDVELEPQPLT